MLQHATTDHKKIIKILNKKFQQKFKKYLKMFKQLLNIITRL